MTNNVHALNLNEIVHNGNAPKQAWGIRSAHPDDVLIHANLLAEVREHYPDVDIKEEVNTKGTNGPNFRYDEPDFVTNGHREKEGQAAANHLGIAYTQFDEIDGTLQHVDKAERATAMAYRALKQGITTFLTVMTGEHPDHTAVADITRMAAAMMNKAGHEVSVLEVLPLGIEKDLPEHIPKNSLLTIDATEESTRLALEIAMINRSQFEIRHTPPEKPKSGDNWIAYHGFYVEEKTLNRLKQYPITETAAYRFWSPKELGALAVEPLQLLRT